MNSHSLDLETILFGMNFDGMNVYQNYYVHLLEKYIDNIYYSAYNSTVINFLCTDVLQNVLIHEFFLFPSNCIFIFASSLSATCINEISQLWSGNYLV